MGDRLGNLSQNYQGNDFVAKRHKFAGVFISRQDSHQSLTASFRVMACRALPLLLIFQAV